MAVRKKAALQAMADDMDHRQLKRPKATKPKMRIYQIRFIINEMEPFREWCAEHGITLSAGVRMAVTKYMKAERVK